MKGDFSRDTFHAHNHYSRVLMQQGRVQLDADWNEQAAIHAHRAMVTMADLVGPFGVPQEQPGFAIMQRGGLMFDGQGQYLHPAEQEHLAALAHGPLTIEAWVNPAPGGRGGTVISQFDSGPQPAQGLYRLAVRADGLVELVWLATSHHQPTLHTLRAPQPIPFGCFSHLAVTFDGRHQHLYIDGRLVDAGSVEAHSPPSKIATLIGAVHQSQQTADYFQGLIDDLRVWQTARDASQITQAMYQQMPEHTPALVLRACVAHHQHAFSPVGVGTHASHHHSPSEAPTQWWLRSGRAYLGGLLCENEHDQQLDPPVPPEPAPDHHETYRIAVLTVQERFVSALEAPHLREVALGGADTTARLKLDWQVSFCTPTETERLLSPPAPPARLCAIHQPSARPLENNLYRVEIHHAGAVYGSPLTPFDPLLRVVQVQPEQQQIQLEDWGRPTDAWEIGQMLELRSDLNTDQPGDLVQISALDPAQRTLTVSPFPAGYASARAPAIRRIAGFKWARDNASLAFPVHQRDGATLVIHLGQDDSALAPGDWLELEDDTTTAQGSGTALVQIAAMDTSNHPLALLQLTHNPSCPVGNDPQRHPLVRLWHTSAAEQQLSGCLPARADRWLLLELGINVRFDGSGTCQRGDAWCIPARATPEQIEWPSDADGALALPPQRLPQRHAALAELRWADHGIAVRDLRPVFAPLTAQPPQPETSAPPAVSRGQLELLLQRVEQLERKLAAFEQPLTAPAQSNGAAAQPHLHSGHHSNQIVQTMEALEPLDIGDVVAVAAEREQIVVRADEENASRVLGIVSALIGKQADQPHQRYQVVVYGRTACRVVGPVRAGDLLAPAAQPGYARRGKFYQRSGTILGKALTNHQPAHPTEVGLIDVLVMLG